MRVVLESADHAAKTSGSVLIQGPDGSGKTMLARVIHEEGCPCGPFVMVDCAGVTVENMDVLLFGDASRRALGRLEMAEDGTLLLKNLECLNPVAQERLFSILESGVFVNHQGDKRAATFRLISTANGCTLDEMLHRGTFRREFFDALNQLPIEMPEMADRAEDIPALSIYILDEIASREKIERPRVPYHYLELLTKVEWPENARQLRNHLESVMVLSEGRFDPDIIREHLITESEPATIKGAVTSMWRRIAGGQPEARTATVHGK